MLDGRVTSAKLRRYTATLSPSCWHWHQTGRLACDLYDACMSLLTSLVGGAGDRLLFLGRCFLTGSDAVGEVLNTNRMVGLAVVLGICGVAVGPTLIGGYGILPGAVVATIVLIVVTFNGAYLKWNAVATQAEVASPYAALVAEMAKRDYSVGGEDVPGDELFLRLAPQFSSPTSEAQLRSWIYQRIRDYNQLHPATPIAGEAANDASTLTAHEVIEHWYLDGLLDPEIINRPGTPDPKTGHFPFGSGPRVYAVYTLNAKGRELVAHLRKRSVGT